MLLSSLVHCTRCDDIARARPPPLVLTAGGARGGFRCREAVEGEIETLGVEWLKQKFDSLHESWEDVLSTQSAPKRDVRRGLSVLGRS